MNNSESPALLILEKKPFQDEEEEIKSLPSSFKALNQYFEVFLLCNFQSLFKRTMYFQGIALLLKAK